jgi:hypothetical protein
VKRLIVLLVFLIAVGAVVFFFGWIQIKLGPDEHAVIFTKTNGWEEQVIEPGTFTWRWQRLLPTNLTLYVFTLTPEQTNASIRGSLPSASTYATILDGAGGFSYAVTLDISYRIAPASLPTLAREDGLRPDGLQQYYDSLESQLAERAKNAVMQRLADDPGDFGSTRAYSRVEEAALEELGRSLPQLEVLAVDVVRLELPDLALYEQARDRYAQVVETRAQALSDAAAAFARRQTETDSELQMLERYGEILDRYPILLDYFRLGTEIDADPLSLESLIPQTSQ